jgi:pimeloyl-ACP methyl ester carboxylesterase
MSPRLQQWLADGRYFQYGQHRLFYRDEGQGPVLLLLHGYPTGSFDWFAVWQALLPDHRLLAPDLLGLGFSDKPRPGAYELADHAHALDAWLQSLGVRKLCLVAHDLGVRVAQEMLARREEQAGLPSIAALLLINGAMCPEAYRPRFIQRLLASRLGPLLGPRIPRSAVDRTLRGLFGLQTQPADALLDDFWDLLNFNAGRGIAHRVGQFWQTTPARRERLVGALLRSQARLALLNGAFDPNSGRHMVQRLLELAPATEVLSLDDIGHWPHIESPDLVANAIARFAAGLPLRS